MKVHNTSPDKVSSAFSKGLKISRRKLNLEKTRRLINKALHEFNLNNHSKQSRVDQGVTKIQSPEDLNKFLTSAPLIKFSQKVNFDPEEQLRKQMNEMSETSTEAELQEFQRFVNFNSLLINKKKIPYELLQTIKLEYKSPYKLGDKKTSDI